MKRNTRVQLRKNRDEGEDAMGLQFESRAVRFDSGTLIRIQTPTSQAKALH